MSFLRKMFGGKDKADAPISVRMPAETPSGGGLDAIQKLKEQRRMIEKRSQLLDREIQDKREQIKELLRKGEDKRALHMAALMKKMEQERDNKILAMSAIDTNILTIEQASSVAQETHIQQITVAGMAEVNKNLDRDKIEDLREKQEDLERNIQEAQDALRSGYQREDLDEEDLLGSFRLELEEERALVDVAKLSKVPGAVQTPLPTVPVPVKSPEEDEIEKLKRQMGLTA